MPETELIYLNTERYKNLLLYHGHYYTRKCLKKDKTSRWTCFKAKENICHASVTISEDGQNVVREGGSQHKCNDKDRNRNVDSKNMVASKMDSSNTMSGDEEFMDDLISLSPLTSGDSDCEIVSVSENKSRPEIKKQDIYEQKKPSTESSYGKDDFYLPARFFDNKRNRSLLLKCRPLGVIIVDCGKFPQFYRKQCGIRKPRPKSKQTHTLKNLLQDMSYMQKLKENKHDKLASEYKEQSKQVVGQVNLTPSKLPDVNFKKNIGLVGLKIERKLVGLVFDENSKEERKHKNKSRGKVEHHKLDKTKNKTLECNETRHENAYESNIDNNKVSKEQAKPNEILIDKGNKLLNEKETSLKCSLNLNPLLSPSVQQKLLEIASKSVQRLSSSNMTTYNNKTFIGKTVKQFNANTTKVSLVDSVSDKNLNAAPTSIVVLDKNSIPSTPSPSIAKNVETEIPKTNLSIELESKKEGTPNEVTEPEQVHIKTEPEIKQELKDEATDKAPKEDPIISMTHPNLEVQPVSLSSNLRNFRRSIENTSAHANTIEDLRQFVGRTIPVQTTAVVDQNIVSWHRYNEAGIHVNCERNCPPSDNLSIPQTQPNVNNIQVSYQNTFENSTKPKVGDLKIQTVSQINSSVVQQVVSAHGEAVHHMPVVNVPIVNDIQNNAHQFLHNVQVVQGLETTVPVPESPLLNSGRVRKIVKIRNTHLINDQNRHVAVGPYTGPPYHPYGYQPQPLMRASGPVAHWIENSHLANKMPILSQQLNRRQQPMQSHSYWHPPAPNQEYFYRSGSANLNHAYDEFRYHNQWNRQPRAPPPHILESRMKYAPPYQRRKVWPQRNISPNSKPDERGVFTQAALDKSAINQGPTLPPFSTFARPHPPQSVQGDNHRELSTPVPTLPTPPNVTGFPTLSPQPLTPSLPKPVQDMHAAEILYPNTTFSQESANTHVVYTEGTNHINVATHENQQTFVTENQTIKMIQTPAKALDMPIISSIEIVGTQSDKVSDVLSSLDMPIISSIEIVGTQSDKVIDVLSSLDMPIISSIESEGKQNDEGSNVLSSQPKARHDTLMKSNPSTSPIKLNGASNNLPSSQQQTIDNPPTKCMPTVGAGKTNDASNNVPSSQKEPIDNTPIKLKPTAGAVKPKDTYNNLLSSQLQTIEKTPTKLKHTGAVKPKDTSNNLASSQQLQAENNTPSKSKTAAAAGKPNDLLPSQKEAKDCTPIKSSNTTTVSKPNDTDNNVLSPEQQAKNKTPIKSKPTAASTKPNDPLSSQKQAKDCTSSSIKSRPTAAAVSKPNDTSNKVSQEQLKNTTPKKQDSTVVPKHIHVAKNVPKKRPYIPNNDAFPFESTTISERSVLERNANKGYSPPILPIPTIQKSLEILGLVNAIKTPNHEPNNSIDAGPLTPVKQSGHRNNLVEDRSKAITPRKVIAPICMEENPANERKLESKKVTAPICIVENPGQKRKPDHTPQSATKARKISIEEYKKRQESKYMDLTDDSKDHRKKESSPTKDSSHKKRYNNNNENRAVDLQDLGYDSDPPSKF